MRYQRWVGRRGKGQVALAMVAAAVAVPPVLAADDNWINPAGGNFADGPNWSLGAPPTMSDNALFNVPGTYTILVSSGASDSASFTAGNVTLDGMGFAEYGIKSSIAVAS